MARKVRTDGRLISPVPRLRRRTNQDNSALGSASGSYYTPYDANGTLEVGPASSVSIDLTVNRNIVVDMATSGTDCDLLFTNPPGPTTFMLEAIFDGFGGDLRWPDNTQFPNGIPTYTGAGASEHYSHLVWYSAHDGSIGPYYVFVFGGWNTAVYTQ